jgi:hypothetical protein
MKMEIKIRGGLDDKVARTLFLSSKVCSNRPSSAFQILMVLSAATRKIEKKLGIRASQQMRVGVGGVQALASQLPSVENLTLEMAFLWPCSVYLRM